MTKKIMIYLNFYISCVVLPFILMIILQIVAVTFEIKEIIIPGIINSEYIKVYNKGLEGFGGFASFPDALLYALIATIIFFLISWLVPLISKNNSKK